jgi:TetR/AcrR family transcriptional regulator, transcriptional repressor for nem operon
MPKPSNRDKLLQQGLKVVLAQGYSGASVRDIVRAAGVPQGSFTNHFTSKEAFAEEVLDLYFSLVRANIEKTLRNDSLPPFRRLQVWFDAQIAFLKKAEFRTGCLIGNFSIEAGDQSELIRRRLIEFFKDIHQSIVYCLKAAVDAGELSPSTDLGEVASFLYSSWHGAILQSKVELSIKPLERFKRVLFEKILH